MTIALVRTSLIQGVVDAQLTGIPIQWPNMPITLNGNPYQPNNELWCRATILNMDDRAVTLGRNGFNLLSGVLQIDIFTTASKGDISGADTADKVREIFHTGAELHNNDQCVKILEASFRTGQTNDQWYHQMVIAEFNSRYRRGT